MWFNVLHFRKPLQWLPGHRAWKCQPNFSRTSVLFFLLLTRWSCFTRRLLHPPFGRQLVRFQFSSQFTWLGLVCNSRDFFTSHLGGGCFVFVFSFFFHFEFCISAIVCSGVWISIMKVTEWLCYCVCFANLVSHWILTSCQTHRIISGWSNSVISKHKFLNPSHT